jgi:hypothetical protein
MQKTADSQDLQPGDTCQRGPALILLWLAIVTGWIVSICSVIEEMCMASACSDAASFTLFGFNMGWFGIVYFSSMLLVLWFRKRFVLLDWAFTGMVFAGIGSEFRLLWIQKYIIGSWCPLCVTICGALFTAALLLIFEKFRLTGPFRRVGTVRLLWVVLAAAMIAIGLAVAVAGVKELT